MLQSRPPTRSAGQQHIQLCCMMAIDHHPGPVTAAARGQHYKGRCPTYASSGGSVSYHEYPDPTDFGWILTGSCEGGRAKFFEKDFAEHGIVKLDFYYSTGTVKTVLDHPRQGVTQLFAKGTDISSALYRKILRNPHEHTSIRYHRK